MCSDAIEFAARWPLTDEEVHSYCHYLAGVAEEVSPQSLPPVIQDPKDHAVLETAVAGAVSIIPCRGRSGARPAVPR